MQTLSPKDPAEQITVTFNFSELLSAVNTVSMQTKVIFGVDATPAAILAGSPETDGNIVRHAIIGGIEGVTYSIRCQATGPEGLFVLAARLTITTDE